MTDTLQSSDLLAKLQSRQPLLWLNPHLGRALPRNALSPNQIAAAEARLAHCEPLMEALFPELADSSGKVESCLMPAEHLRQALMRSGREQGAWFIKRDDALPIAGSIKARGGFHEVLALAESIAIEHGLGFEAIVHMSTDAKLWKKERLRTRGVRVVEHEGDYAQAVAAGRTQALATPRCHFVDDEGSSMLFLGYAAGARYLAAQLAEAGRIVDGAHPLFVYLPCGVGGAPGGITYGLKALFDEHVHCFFAEPVASPCMLVQLAADRDEPMSVYDVGLDNRTDADGLAVGQASYLVSPLMASQLAGVFTVNDEQLYAQLLMLKQTMGIELEPSAAAGMGGPAWLAESPGGRAYVRSRNLDMAGATHVIWATGGSLVPPEEHRRFQAHAEALASRVSST